MTKGLINKQLHLEQHEDTHNSIKRLNFSHLLSVYLIFYSFRPFKKWQTDILKTSMHWMYRRLIPAKT
ncbi:hypothetical protein EA860_22640, partial [Vibrio anguillarum]|nr:hypothetical protein [Vibrio anguillarum]